MNQRPHRPHSMFEWASASMMVGIAICILLTPKTIEMGAFRFMVNAGFTPGYTALCFTIGGTGRMFALLANGRFKYGTQFRAWGAVLGSFLWCHMTVALILLTSVTGTLSIGIPVYGVFAVCEIISCYRVVFETDTFQPTVAGGSHAVSKTQRSVG